MRKVGCFVGKFLPPHIGHLSVIDKAIKECEKVIVVLAENPERSEAKCREASFPYFLPTQRIKWLEEHYKNNPNVKFVFLNESGLKSFPEGLDEWSARFKEVVKDKITAKYADESYRELNEKYFPECEFVPIDREAIAVHGTDIRTKRDYLNYVIPEGYEDIKKALNKEKKMNKENNMLIDFYELTMGQAYFNQGMKDKKACFDLFYRRCPDKAAFSLAGNIQQAIEFLRDFRFDKDEIDYLRSLNIFTNDYLDYLSTMKFTGDVYAVQDGMAMFPNEPVITIVAPIIEAQIVETKLLTIFNRSSLVTSKANRIVRAAQGRAVMEFGTRRAHGESSANEGALDAYVGGAIGTACTMTGMQFGVPVLGTMAHSFIQSFDNEYEAFKAYAQSFPNNATFLVDTYDTLGSGVPNAIKVAKEVLEPMGKQLAGIRIDSGDLAYLSKQARKMLNDAGLYGAKICVSNSLDEYLISDLLKQGAPIDSFGVGENLITAKSEPVFGGVYKLTALEDEKGKMIPKIKISDNIEKVTNPGFKDIVRLYDDEGKIITDVVQLFEEELPSGPIKLKDPNSTWKYTTIKDYTPVKIKKKMMEKGEVIYDFKTPAEKRAFVSEQIDSLREENLRLTNAQTITISLSPKLAKLKENLLAEHNKGKKTEIAGEIFDLDEKF